MKRKPLRLLASLFVLGAIGFGIAVGKDESPGKKSEPPSVPKTNDADASPQNKPVKKDEGPKAAEVPKPGAETDPAEQNATNQPEVDPELAADEETIRATGETFVKAYNDADAEATAAHFAEDAEYIDGAGNVYDGREAIQEAVGECFESNPGGQIDLYVQSIRFVSRGVAIEDGTTVVSDADGENPITTIYTAIHVKTDGKWQVVSVRERPVVDTRQHRVKLEELAWLQGDWIDEDEEVSVIFSCAPTDNDNFLLRKFTIRLADQEVMSGTQRIGWDPLTGKLRTWIFDSEGGFSDGYWYCDEDRWVLKTSGVTADGEPASASSIYTLINEHTMTWQVVDFEIAGIRQPDSEPVTIVRRAPSPESLDEAVSVESK